MGWRELDGCIWRSGKEIIHPLVPLLLIPHHHFTTTTTPVNKMCGTGMLLVTVLLGVCGSVSSLDNGMARTPPMGWLSWQRFRCNTDCVNDPHHCISESLFMQMADIIVNEGYRDLGYQLVSVDDCWLSRERDARGRLQADPHRFPSGIPALSDYMHKRGLSFGIYEDYGNYTCAGYPGILGHLEIDAFTFAEWGVDYVKLDGCYSHPTDMDRGYPLFGYYLNQTLRPMVYSCSWPVYQTYSGLTPNYTSIINTCNLWRNFDDIQDSWESVQRIIDYYGDNQQVIVPNAGPGHWNDPDMLIIGNFGLSYEQSKSQMAMWAIFAAPLLMSVDLRTIRPEFKAILQNKGVIGVNQDPLGIQGKRIYKDKGIEIWARPITPVFQGHYSYAIAFLNRRTDGTPSEVSVTLRELGLAYPNGYGITDLFDGVHYGTVLPDKRFKVDVNPSGVVLVRCEVIKGSAGAARFREQPQPNSINNPFQNNVFNQFGPPPPPPRVYSLATGGHNNSSLALLPPPPPLPPCQATPAVTAGFPTTTTNLPHHHNHYYHHSYPPPQPLLPLPFIPTTTTTTTTTILTHHHNHNYHHSSPPLQPLLPPILPTTTTITTTIHTHHHNHNYHHSYPPPQPQLPPQFLPTTTTTTTTNLPHHHNHNYHHSYPPPQFLPTTTTTTTTIHTHHDYYHPTTTTNLPHHHNHNYYYYNHSYPPPQPQLPLIFPTTTTTTTTIAEVIPATRILSPPQTAG
ncbi:hypothetical protein Pcinc_022127 [Petrolisthes cinctipes]|uniref:Alpha-galactosidase n=1 Tax=Petrolisthes cinctipes TaxID=88211 RepID=A0AAE1KE54_PETCI|nr:hypothetical protein Pcinc_022127 [Petrolisthes cinctipes]